MNKSIERLARRCVPSLSRLSHNPLFKFVVDAPDLLPRFIWPEFRTLPPNHLRIRVGVGNRLFSNQTNYLSHGENFWLHYISTGAVTTASTVVDIGCGCGRFAHHLRDFRYQGTTFSGRYLGIDIDQEMLDWCCKHFDTPRFSFIKSNHANKSYKQTSSQSGRYAIPVADQEADFVFSRSLFTHLLEPELRNYLEESFRIMKVGAHMVMSFFSLDHPPPTYGGRHTFSHTIGNAAVESLTIPEAAVAYKEAFIMNLAREVGFSKAVAISDEVSWQSDLVARK